MEIKSVEFYDDIEYQNARCTGYEIITTSNEVIRVMIDNFQACGEEFGVVIDDGAQINKLIGRAIENIGWDHESLFGIKCIHGSACYNYTATIEILLDNGEIVKVIAYYERNRYYRHTVFYEWPGRSPDFQVI